MTKKVLRVHNLYFRGARFFVEEFSESVILHRPEGMSEEEASSFNPTEKELGERLGVKLIMCDIVHGQRIYVKEE